MTRLSSAALAAAFALFVGQAFAVAASPAIAPPPVERYAEPEAMGDVQLSQDGQRIAYIAATGDDHVFIVKQIGGPVLLTVAGNRRKVNFISFADPDHLLLGIRGTEHLGGDTANYEASAIIAYDLKTKRGSQVFPKEGVVVSGAPVAVVHQGGHVYGYFYGRSVDTEGSTVERVGLYKTDLDSLVSTLEVKGENNASSFAVGPDGKVLGRVEEFDHGKDGACLRARAATACLPRAGVSSALRPCAPSAGRGTLW